MPRPLKPRRAVHARVYSTGAFPDLIWHFEVYSSAGKVVLYDNTGQFAPILKSALIRVTALRHMETAGHKLRPYKGHRG